MCRDYVSEKVFQRMADSLVIPIVMGGANYSAHLPPHSYINVEEFKSPRELASHLK